MRTNKVEKIYPLSNMQKGILYHSIKGTSSNAYFEQMIMDIKGSINEDFLEESFNKIMRRHEILRASFSYKRDEPLHVILKDRKIKFNYKDLSAVDASDKKSYIESFLEEDRLKGFDITKETLMRVCLIKMEESSYKLVWSFHHILLDGWCVGIIIGELFTIYSNLLNGTKHQLEDPRPYSDYIKWLNSQDTEGGLVFWGDYLKGYDVKTTIPKLPNGSCPDYKRGERIIEFSEEMTEKVMRLATRNNVTLNTVLQSIWGLILAKYNNTEDAVFGTVVSGRDASVEGIEKMVGLFINTIPTRIKFENDYTFQKLLKLTQESALDTTNYNFISLADIQSQSTLKNNLLDHVLVFENYAVDEEAIQDKESELGFEIVSVTDEERSNYNFSITVGMGKKLKLMLVFDESVYERDLINSIAAHIENVTLQVSENDTKKISEIELLSDTEKQVIFNNLNQTNQLYPKQKLIHQLFEEQAEKTPDHIAVTCGDKKLTYLDLNRKSNQIAQMLREKGIQTNEVVAILSDRSLEMIIGIMGILKSGAAYLPIDPDTPADRVDFMLKDSNAFMLLTKDLFMKKFRFEIEAVNLDEVDYFRYSNENLSAINNSHDAAYIIYTSGSTGNPKGVVIPHYSAIRVVKNTNYIEISESDSILQLSNYSFDGSVFDIFGSLLNGANLVMVEKEVVLDLSKLSEVIKNKNISVMFITTALFNTLVDLEIDCLDNLRKILFGGERVSVPHVRKALKKLGENKLIHVYGPTESTVFATYYFINKETEIIPIGKPIANTSVFIVGKGNQLLPVGVPGELCISGDGLSSGYLNNENLTAEKFVPNPFSTEEKMYRTGDLVRMLPDGNIEFLDRIDNQVKLRGYRIELGEIENRLLQCHDVKEAVVTIRRDKDEQQFICAYFTSDSSKLNLMLEIRAFLEQTLPHYMIPSFFVQMDYLPLTKNGKVNKAVLPEPNETNLIENHEPPSNEVEEKLLSIWKDILSVENIGVNQSFFEVGGHSLKATALISRIHKEFKVEIPLRQIFNSPTIKGLGDFINSAKESIYSSIKPVEEKAFYPVSSAQKRLFILNQIEGTGISYNMPFAVRINGNLNIKQLEKAFIKLIERHQSLRTSFSMVDGEPVQKIQKISEFKLSYKNADPSKVDSIISKFVRPFDLESAPLLRVEVITLSEEEHILMLDMHHIISDGVSMGILMNDLANFYEGKELKPIRLQYKDYSAWQKELYGKEELKNQEAYWTNVFKDEIPVLDMPTDYKRPLKQSVEGSQHSFEITRTLTEKLNQIAKENGVTMYMLLLASYTTLLSKYTKQDDIIVGSPIAGRSHNDLKNIVGLFVNTLAMRNFPKGQKTFVQYLMEVKDNALKAYENQDYPFDELVEKLNINRDMSRNALFDTMFVLQNLEAANNNFKDLKFETFETKTKIAKFDLTLSAIETDNTIKFDLEYCTALFKKETAERISNHFVSVLREVSKNPQICLGQIDILTEEEKEAIFGQYNQTQADYPKDKTIQQLFMEQAERTPERVAVVCGEEALTYRELNERSNQIARMLLEKGVQAETIVGIMADRSPEMIAGLVGILKSGAAYLPIDPEYPEERIKYLVEDSNINLLLTQDHLLERISFSDLLNIDMISLDDKRIAKAAKTNLIVKNNPSDLAYVIYTSGSTGQPKGVLVEHRSLANLCHWYVNFHEIQKGDRITNYLKISFDASITEIFPCLISGAELHVLSGDIRLDMGKLNRYMNEKGITVATLPYKVAEQFIQQDNHSLRMLISGGEQLNVKADTEYQLVNAYGPTENTCVTTSYFVKHKGHNLPIGKPVNNTNIYILNQDNRLCPVGVAGELCVSGDGVARGYLNNPELTAEKFVSNPFEPGGRMYRTGDLARWLPDGNIEFIGRVDHQVKLRGYRIELGEIESHLLKHPGVKEAVVIIREDSNLEKSLCGYLVCEEQVTPAEVRKHLEKRVPEYMIPAYFVQLDKLPLTSNDKVDRKALPEPEKSALSAVEYEAPRNAVESILVETWADILSIEELGINHHFFVSGGDSIKALQIVSRLSRFNLKLEVKDLFANPTIKNVSKYVKKQEKRIKAYEIVKGKVELMPIQHWFFENNKDELDHFNQSFMIYRKEGFDVDLVKMVFNKLLEHHDALRMIYEVNKQGISQYNRGLKKEFFNFYNYDIKGMKNAKERVFDLATDIQKKSSITDGKLVNVGLFQADDGDHLLIAIHHLVVDGVSWRILFEDFETLYVQAESGQPLDIGPKSDSFQHFSLKLQEYANSKELKKESDYWRNVAQAKVKFLPKKNEINRDTFENSKTLSVKLDSNKTHSLLRAANRAYNTEINDILLTSLLVGAREVTGENRIKINMEGHGREDILKDLDISRTVGWFTTMYPILFDLGEEKGISQNIKMVKEILRKVPNKGIGFGIIKYLSTEIDLGQEQKAVFSFNYLGEMDNDVNRAEFSGSKFSYGESIGGKISRNNSIEINSIIINNELYVNTTFNESEYDEETISLFNEKFKESLEQIINHCSSKKESEKTPYDYGDFKLTLKELAKIEKKYGDLKIEKIYPLANMQKGMLFHALENKNSRAYFEQTVMDIKGKINKEVLKKSFNKVMQRHEILRASFEYEIVEEPRHIIIADREIDFYYIDIKDKSLLEKETYIQNYREKDKKIGFNLAEDTLIRVTLIRTGEESYKLVWSHHHILLDGWCLSIVLAELFTIYSKMNNGEGIEIEDTKPYSDYINWLEKQDIEEGRAYWKNYLKGYKEKTEIPKLNNITHNIEYSRKEKNIEFSKDTTNQLKDLANKCSVTFNTLFQSIWGTALAKYNNTDEVVFGSIVSGREAPVDGIEKMIGLFINAVPTRIKLDKDARFRDVLSVVQKEAIESNYYNYLNLAEVQSLSELKKDLLDHIIVFENYAIDDRVTERDRLDIGFEVEDLYAEEQSNYRFSVSVTLGEKLNLVLTYDGNVYDEVLIDNIEGHLNEVTKQVVSNLNKKIGDIQIISEKEKILFGELNNTNADYPENKTIHQLFEDQAERTPEKIAVVYENVKLTYRELNEQSNHLAAMLRQNGVKRNTIVGIKIERSLEMVIGMLGILKAGGAYLPIDPGYPKERIEYLIKDSGIEILLKKESENTEFYLKCLNIDLELFRNQIKENLPVINESSDLAYIIYTSGSTGKPKGVMVNHSSILNTLCWRKKYYQFNENDVTLQMPSFSFDSSVEDIFTSLISGAQLVLIEDIRENLNKLIIALNHYKVTNLLAVPSYYKSLLEMVSEPISSLRFVTIAGEGFSDTLINNHFRKLPDVQLFNEYGPTENSVCSTVYKLEPGNQKVLIGKPITNNRVYLLNQNNSPVPFGVPGELCVSGAGLARGYLNRPELTAEKFVPNPFLPGERMYRTGDLARMLPDGNIEFLGRIDHQVKIRGHRIELGEIENRLLKLPKVKEAVVISREDKDRQAYLCAYVVMESQAEESVKEIRSQLANDLPDFMIPAFFVQLEKMPLTANGKVDRKGLPEPDVNGGGDQGYEAPRNAIEETLASIWKDILGIGKVGIHDHFFEMGGHSLKATALVSRIHKELKAEVPLRQLFQTPTIEGISEFISGGRKSVFASIEKVEERQHYALSPAQRRLFILNQIEGGVSYNMPLAMEIQGDLNVNQLERAVMALIERHEALRTSFSMEDGVPVQKIAPTVEFKVGYRKSDAHRAETFLKEEFVRPFDLSTAPLLRMEVLNIEENKHLMVLDMHHIISDGVSMGIFTRELAELYEGKELPALKIQYKDYSAWQKQAAARAEMKKQEEYWLNVFKEEVSVLNMPTDFGRPAAQSTEGDLVHFEFGRDLSLKLKKMAKEQGVTLYMLLLAGYTTLLSKYTGQEDIIVGSPIAGRPHDDLKNVMGIFLNTLAMRNYPEGKKSFSTYLREVRENALSAFENQDYPFDELVEKLDLNRDMSRSALFDVMLVLQNFDQEVFELEGLAFTPHPVDAHVSKFDLTLTASEEEDRIPCVLNYGTKLFKKETIERMASHLIHLFESIVQQPDQLISELTLLPEDEAQAALDRWNDTSTEFPVDKTLAQLFEEQTMKTPNRVAVAAVGQKLTYLQLNERANQWARVLQEKGAKPGKTIGLIAEESLEMIIGILAVLKAGAAYLPIDPDQAVKRTNAILQDSGASLLLVKGQLTSGLSFCGDIIDLEAPLFEGRETANLPVGQPDHNAYLIYTSGSTGTPKGVFIQHRSVVNYMSWFKQEADLREEDKAMLVSSYAFDLGYTTLYSALLNGCELHLVKKEVYANPFKALRYLNENGISYLKLTPSLFNVLVNDPVFLKGASCETLRLVVLGGEKISPQDVKTFHLHCPKAVVMNHYGPTEATIGAVYHVIDFEKISDFEECPVIGRPISNMKAYVMDSQMKPVPEGVYGELCLSGAGVANAYLNRPDLTEDVFVRNPLDPNEAMYRTGDLVRRLPDGNLELAGRMDNQVKIRGYRIEPDEIKNQLLKHTEIQEAAVIVRKDNDQRPYICAYIRSGKEWTLGELRSYLMEEIPEYMIPSHFVQLERIPLTPNGKVDRKALPEPDRHTGVEYEAPRNEVEKKLAAVWEEILGLSPIGISHNFFASGGDSIKALQIISRLSREGISLEMKELFAHPEIKRLSRYAKTVNGQEETFEIETGHAQLTPIQKAFFSGGTEEVNHYNHAVMLYRKEGFHAERIKEVLEEIMKHHDALRMIYPNENGEIRPYNRGVGPGQFGFTVFEVSSEEVPNQAVLELATKLQLQMDIESGPLVNAAVFKAKDGDHLLLVIHHLVVDGLSWRILFEDLALGYSQLENGEPVSFYPKTTSYKTYASKLQAYAEGKKLAREKQYWVDVLKEPVPFLETKGEAEAYWYEDSHTFSTVINKEATRKLLRETNHAYHTDINDLLVTALLMATRRETAENRIRLSLEGHGREPFAEEVDISRTVGWFSAKYPVLIDLGEEKSLSMTIKMVKETLRKIPNKGIGYGILKYLSEASEFKEAQQPPLLFNYLGQMDEDLQNAAFSSSSLPTGESVGNRHVRENAMEINAVVLDGQLVIDTTYNTNVYAEQTVKDFAEAYKEALYTVIGHCAAKGEPERTPSDYGDKALSISELEDIRKKYEGFEIEKIYPLANMQQGMLFHSLENPSSRAYFEQIIIEATGTIDPHLMENSFNAILERHELLRSAIEYKITVQPRNVILKNRKIGFGYQDIRMQSAEQQKASMDRFLEEDREKGFDLSRDPLIRLQLIRTGDETYTLIWSNHHILFDGWGRGIILAELFHLYGNERFGRTGKLEEPEAYSTYIKWLEEKSKEEAFQYWENYLKGYKDKAGIPAIRKPGESGDSRNREKVIEFSRELTGKLADLAARNQVTFHTALQSAWGVLLAKYNQTDDVVFGSVVSGRDAKVPGIENMVGLFINTVPTRIQASDHQRFREVLQRVQEDAIESQAYSYVNLSDVQSLSELKRDLIDHVMVFENYALDEQALEQGEDELGFVFEELKGNEATNYGLTVVAVPGEHLVLKFAYDENQYPKMIIDNLAMHLTHLMEQAAEDEDQKIGDLQLLSIEEKDQILKEFNQTQADYPKDKTIQQLFMEQAERTPERVAVVCGEEALTYRELNERSNQIARMLLEKGVQAETIVGIMADRSPEMIAGMIGILKCGAAYLPIDPEYPEGRITYLLEDSRTNLLLTNREDSLKYNVDTIFLNGDFKSYSIENIDVALNPLNNAYVIYTSGSTGKPKGTMITQKGLVNYIYWANKKYVNEDALDFALYSSISFDLTVTSIFTPLIAGNKVIVYRSEENEPLIRKVFKDNKAGIVKLTPSHLSLIKDLDNSSSSIKCLIIGGEDLKSDLALKISESFNHNIELYNEYGPTEATVGCMIYKYDMEKDKANSIPIGRPSDNVQIIILNEKQEIVPIGVKGELYISGDGLAVGYLNNPDLTNEKFIFNSNGQRMYRTGDLAKRLPDGNIEFLGRIDHQVKVRGYRIELGEIERAIEKSGKVKDNIVVASGEGDNQYLCAYVILKDAAEIDELRNYLYYELPGFMVPSSFVALEEFPLTTNGKVDINALPDHNGVRDNSNGYIPPSNNLESMLAAIWEEILNIKNISVTTNLFEIGANSLNVMTFVSMLYSKMNFRIPFKDVFNKPTIRSLSIFLENAKNLLKDYTEDCIQLTNSTASDKKLFCFPPAASLGIAYMGLAEHLERYSVYSFNFIKSENRIRQYAEIMKEYQPEGPYTLVGYSAGGVLAFEVAKELNRQGYEVEDLILIDTSFRSEVEENILTEEEYKKELYDKFDLEKYKDLEKLASDYLIELIMKSYMYVQGTITDGSINGNIHYIKSVREKYDSNMMLWAKATTKKFSIIQGFGTHMEMLTNMYPETLEKNSKIIDDVLSFETV